ncbi:MAG: DUF1573 domain-containing protein [Muribaculaceae bacterium]|nr:DUF1573 domain-containing protein [Muribaculaceae bacterium]
MKRLIITINIVILAVALISGCRSENATHANIISEWIGREIMMPNSLVYLIKDDTINFDLNRADFKIVNFIDSTGCTTCRMKLDQWNELISEFKALNDIDIEVLSIVNTKNIKGLMAKLGYYHFLSPIVIDTDNTFYLANNLPSNTEHHCFLLDSKNRVVAIGNPVLNPKIKDIYLQHMTADKDDQSCNEIYVHPAKALGVVQNGQSVTKSFYLNSVDSAQYTLQAIVPSCECIDVTVEPQNELGILKVDVTFSAYNEKGSFTRYVDIFFNEKDCPERLIVYGYIKQ